MSLRAKAVLLGFCLVLTAPSGAHASTPDRRGHDRCSEEGSCSDDHGEDGRRDRCVGFVAFCGATVTIPPGVLPGGQRPKAIPACPPTLPVLPHCDPKPASLLPPSPQKLVQAMNAMAKGIGEAAGALAGAIVGGVGGIFL